LFHSDTIIPFGRIQHIDVDQGPVQRRYDLATLSVHTAGSHNDTVSLPGLLHADALALRETIRAHIRSGQR
jgi:membrane protein YdbS with pleckstrin-like domain